VLQSAPSNTVVATVAELEQNTYFVRHDADGAANGNGGVCLYYLVSALDINSPPAANSPADTNLRGIEYTPATGQVLVFGN
jgi:MSHA pilin protein MshB